MVKPITNFFNAWDNAPKDLRVCLIGVVFVLSISGAIAIGKSDKVEVDRDGFTISNQAVANQEGLEKALLALQIQKAAIEQHEGVTQEFARKYPAAKEILESAGHVADILPDTTIDDLEKTIDQSELLLNKELTH